MITEAKGEKNPSTQGFGTNNKTITPFGNKDFLPVAYIENDWP
jgi:hypothetical protein